MLVLAMLGFAAAATGTRAAEPDTARQQAEMTKPLIVARSCASECQSQHDRCRVETKGSRTCDEVRQHCLQICLQKKRK
jgi:hypothetical protein